jgi:hypothetical protein
MILSLRIGGLFRLVALALLCGASAGVRAQNNPLVTVDEFGQGSVLFPSNAPVTTTGSLQADPGPGGLANALTYNLLGPPGLVAGDLFIFDQGTSLLSDVVRFNPAGTSPGYLASLVFYSQPGGGALADTGFPASSYANFINLFESLAGDLFYSPTAGQPGFVPGFSVTYHIISDGVTVPETGATLPILGCGVAGLLITRRFLRQPRP